MSAPLQVRTHTPPQAARISTRSLAALGAQAEADVARVAAAYARGRAEALAEVGEGAAAALEAATTQLEAASERALEEIPRDAVLLAVEIAGQLLKVRIDAGEYDLERIIRSSLDDSGVGRAECTVHLHPGDHEQLDGVAFRSGTRIEADTQIQRGEVHISTPRGLLVRDLDAALESIREQLLEDLA